MISFFSNFSLFSFQFSHFFFSSSPIFHFVRFRSASVLQFWLRCHAFFGLHAPNLLIGRLAGLEGGCRTLTESNLTDSGNLEE